MKPHQLRAKAAIVGFGDSYCGNHERKSALRLAAEAARVAIADAGLAKDDIDGVLTGRAPGSDRRLQWNNIFSAYAKFTPTYSSEITIHAAGMNSMLKHAAMAVTSGVARFVLCVGADSDAHVSDKVKGVVDIDTDPEFELPFGLIVPSLYAQVARRLMHEYGITEEHLSTVSVQCQNWGVHHPYATKARKGRITIDQVMASPMVSSPLRLWHCAAWGPAGTGGAMIVTSVENAEAMTKRPIYILGSGECETHEYLTDRLALRSSRLDLGKLPNITTTGCGVAADLAFDMAGVGRDEIDIVQTASNFSHIELMALSELGFASKHEVGDFVKSGATDVGGSLPTNTNGGWLSFGQPGVSCVMDSLVEAVRQLRGEALGKQVEDARVALVHAVGGMTACNSVTILSTER
jgi:acetyl-CoA acetyltransferase